MPLVTRDYFRNAEKVTKIEELQKAIEEEKQKLALVNQKKTEKLEILKKMKESSEIRKQEMMAVENELLAHSSALGNEINEKKKKLEKQKEKEIRLEQRKEEEKEKESDQTNEIEKSNNLSPEQMKQINEIKAEIESIRDTLLDNLDKFEKTNEKYEFIQQNTEQVREETQNIIQQIENINKQIVDCCSEKNSLLKEKNALEDAKKLKDLKYHEKGNSLIAEIEDAKVIMQRNLTILAKKCNEIKHRAATRKFELERLQNAHDLAVYESRMKRISNTSEFGVMQEEVDAFRKRIEEIKAKIEQVSHECPPRTSSYEGVLNTKKKPALKTCLQLLEATHAKFCLSENLYNSNVEARSLKTEVDMMKDKVKQISEEATMKEEETASGFELKEVESSQAKIEKLENKIKNAEFVVDS